MSRVVGPDWDRLAGLMDIPYCDREEILKNNTKYPDSPSKAKKIFAHFNNDPKFCRHVLQKYLDEMDRSDVYSEVLDVQNEVICGLKQTFCDRCTVIAKICTVITKNCTVITNNCTVITEKLSIVFCLLAIPL